MKTGIERIALERQEQIEKHGWNIEKDALHRNEELIKAALFCIDQERFEWPRKWLLKFRNNILHKNRIDQLTVAGAFIAAEIDRLTNLARLSSCDLHLEYEILFKALDRALYDIRVEQNINMQPNEQTEEIEPTQSICLNCGELHDNAPFSYCANCLGHNSNPEKFDFSRIKVEFKAGSFPRYYWLLPSIEISGLVSWQDKYGISIELKWIKWGIGCRFYNELPNS